MNKWARETRREKVVKNVNGLRGSGLTDKEEMGFIGDVRLDMSIAK